MTHTVTSILFKLLLVLLVGEVILVCYVLILRHRIMRNLEHAQKTIKDCLDELEDKP